MKQTKWQVDNACHPFAFFAISMFSISLIARLYNTTHLLWNCASKNCGQHNNFIMLRLDWLTGEQWELVNAVEV